MTVTREDVLNYLGREEPPYLAAAGLGTDALPYLHELARGEDAGLAAKAVSLAGHIRGGADVLEIGFEHPQLAVRVSAAAAIQHLDQVPVSLAKRALSDASPQVRKWALKSAAIRPIADLRSAIERIASDDPDDILRSTARTVLEQYHSKH